MLIDKFLVSLHVFKRYTFFNLWGRLAFDCLYDMTCKHAQQSGQAVKNETHNLTGDLTVSENFLDNASIGVLEGEVAFA